MLSNQSKHMFENSTLPRTLIKIVGEFAGFDVPYQRGSFWYEVDWGGVSFVRLPTGCSQFGKNVHIHCYTITKRTARSYLLEYTDSIVICESFAGFSYKFKAVFPISKTRRVFPLRRKNDVHQDTLLSSICDDYYFPVPHVKKVNNNFVLGFSESESV